MINKQEEQKTLEERTKSKLEGIGVVIKVANDFFKERKDTAALYQQNQALYEQNEIIIEYQKEIYKILKENKK